MCVLSIAGPRKSKIQIQRYGHKENPLHILQKFTHRKPCRKKMNIHIKTHIQTYKEILRKSSLLKRDTCKMQRHNILLIEELNSTLILTTAILLHLKCTDPLNKIISRIVSVKN